MSNTTWRLDSEARARMIAISGGQRTVPILAEDGDVVQIGWQGRGCVVAGCKPMTSACDIRVRGVVQGVGFRPFVFRLAQANTLAGWVLNDEDGVEIHLEGAEPALDEFVRSLVVERPPAASIHAIDVHAARPVGFKEFTIRDSRLRGRPSVRISPDLPVCDCCLEELFDPANPRYHYPYINCTNCGPRYSVILSLPYDRGNTTMRAWPLDGYCAGQYGDPADRRFHAQPVACPACGPHYCLRAGDEDRRRRRCKHRQDCRVAKRGRDRRREGDRRLSSGVRRAKPNGGEILARSEVSQGETVRADGPETSRLLASLWNSRPRRNR